MSGAAPRSTSRRMATRFTGEMLLHPAQDEALQIVGLGDADEDRVIASLHAFFDDGYRSVTIHRRLVNDGGEHLLVDVVGAAARNQISTRIEQPHCAQVDLLVARDGVWN